MRSLRDVVIHSAAYGARVADAQRDGCASH
jgi:hypothetical protein